MKHNFPHRISIVLPAHNAGQTIQRAVESCLNQTYTDFELILVNDASTDQSTRILQEYASHPQVKLIQRDVSKGVVPALLTGMQQASGELIARMDADDWSHPQRLEKQVAALDQHPHWHAVTCQVHLENPLGEGMQRYVDWVNSLYSPEDKFRERFIESPAIQPSVLMRRSAYDEVGGYQENEWGEDYDLWLRMLNQRYQIGTVPEVLFHWLDRPDCLTRTHDAYSQERFLKAKAYHISRITLIQNHGALIGGAGPIGKSLARHLTGYGITVNAFYEVHPRRIGNRIMDIPVLDMKDAYTQKLPGLLLGAAGIPNARKKMRTWAHDTDYIEGEDFFCVC